MNLKPFRLTILIVLEHLKRSRAGILGAIILFLILAVAQIKFSFFYSPEIIRIGLIGTYQDHDLPGEVTKLVSTGLVAADQNGRVKPDLVTGWEVSNDATEFKFKLKDGLFWIDGSQIKASDLEFSIPNTEVSYPDDRTILFKLKESYSPLPTLLTKPVFKRGTLLGIGPYLIKKIEKSRIFITKISLDSKDSNRPNLYIRFYPSEKVAMAGFNLAEVQVLLGVSDPKLFSSNPKVGMRQKTDYSKIVTVLYRTDDSLMRNRSLRQALSFQAPQITGEEIANHPYPPDIWAYDSSSKKYLSNPEEANAALQRAKSMLSDEQLKEEIILTTTPNLEEVSKMVVKAWRDLGLDAKLRVESGIPQNFQALLITQSIPIDPDQYSLWHATQTKTNLTKYDSKRVDKDLEDGRKIVTEEERKEKYFDFQKTLLEDAPAAFLFFPKYNIVYLKKIELLLDKVLLAE